MNIQNVCIYYLRYHVVGSLKSYADYLAFEQRLYGMTELLKMRTFPINLATAAAATKIVIMLPGLWLQLIDYLLLSYGFKQSVAMSATAPWLKLPLKFKLGNDLTQLLPAVRAAWTVAMSDVSPHQQPPVTAKQNPIVPIRYFRQSSVGQVFSGITGIQSHEAHVSGQTAQMVVEDKLNRGSGPQRVDSGQPQALGIWIHRYSVPRAHQIMEIHRAT